MTPDPAAMWKRYAMSDLIFLILSLIATAAGGNEPSTERLPMIIYGG